MSKKLGEIWLRLGHEAVEKALEEGNGKITPQGWKNIKATLEAHLEKEGVAIKFITHNIGFHTDVWAQELKKEFVPRNKPYRADCSEEEWAEISLRTKERIFQTAGSRLPQERAEVNGEVFLSKVKTLKPGQTMEEAAQRGVKGFAVEDLLNEVDEVLALTKQDRRDRRDAAE